MASNTELLTARELGAEEETVTEPGMQMLEMQKESKEISRPRRQMRKAFGKGGMGSRARGQK